MLPADDHIRLLIRYDITQVQGHMLRLDEATRRARFSMRVNDAFLTGYATRCLATGSVCYGYFAAGILRGVGELHLFDHSGTLPVEAAVSVEPEWRRKGVATQLLSRILQVSQRRRASQVMIACEADNVPMLALAGKFQSDILIEEDDATCVIELARHQKRTPAVAFDRQLHAAERPAA